MWILYKGVITRYAAASIFAVCDSFAIIVSLFKVDPVIYFADDDSGVPQQLNTIRIETE